VIRIPLLIVVVLASGVVLGLDHYQFRPRKRDERGDWQLEPVLISGFLCLVALVAIILVIL
jgi:hypothetical protein